MSWRTELVLFVGTFALFGAVLLWARDADLLVAASFGAAMLILIGALAWKVRQVPRVLVVGARSPDIERLDDALELAGYEVRRCAGPANRPCPVFRGRACPLRRRPTAVIEWRAEGETGRYAPCATTFRVPEVIVEDQLGAEPATVGAMTRMGPDPGAPGVIVAMERLLA